MTIHDHFIRDNGRIDILSNCGEACRVPSRWQPLLGEYDALVAIPDMHMFFYGSPQDCFQYGAKAMRSLLKHLLEVKKDFKKNGQKLAVVQLGDMFELRYPNPSTGKLATREDIIASHPLYTEIYELMKQLNTLFIIGNHDYELAEGSESVLTKTFGNVYVEHGFQADRWYHFSNPHCRMWYSMMYLYATFRKWEARFNRMRRFAGMLSEGQHSALGVLSGERERVTPVDAPAYPLHRLGYYDKRVRDEWRDGRPIRVCLTAHSHRPLLYTHAYHDQSWLVDAGAWTEGRSDFAIITNDEIAVCRYQRATVRVSVPVAAPFFNPEAAMASQ